MPRHPEHKITFPHQFSKNASSVQLLSVIARVTRSALFLAGRSSRLQEPWRGRGTTPCSCWSSWQRSVAWQPPRVGETSSTPVLQLAAMSCEIFSGGGGIVFDNQVEEQQVAPSAPPGNWSGVEPLGK